MWYFSNQKENGGVQNWANFSGNQSNFIDSYLVGLWIPNERLVGGNSAHKIPRNFAATQGETAVMARTKINRSPFFTLNTCIISCHDFPATKRPKKNSKDNVNPTQRKPITKYTVDSEELMNGTNINVTRNTRAAKITPLNGSAMLVPIAGTRTFSRNTPLRMAEITNTSHIPIALIGMPLIRIEYP